MRRSRARRSFRRTCRERRCLRESPETLRYALGEIKGPGIALEFGVASGNTLRTIAARGGREVYGFDSFDGLPEAWLNGMPAGAFAATTCRTSPAPNWSSASSPTASGLPRHAREARRLPARRRRSLQLREDRPRPVRATAAAAASALRRVLQLPRLEADEYRAWTEYVDAPASSSRTSPTRATTYRLDLLLHL